MAIDSVRSKGSSSFFGLSGYAGPFISLFITQLLVPNASFVVHNPVVSVLLALVRRHRIVNQFFFRVMPLV